MVLARKNNKRITIETPVRVANSYGEPIETFQAYAVRWAKIEGTIGREGFNGYQEINTYPTIFRVRYDELTKDISEKMRVSFDSRYYDIEAVVNYNQENKEVYIYGVYRGT
jgi:SPP1 family predicted phage head-tail adaptor